jgi:hypothetical protein
VATYDAGDARLQIFPDASGFKRRLEEDLKKIQVDYKIPVHPDLAQASADLERWRLQQQRNAIELKVDVDTAAASAKIGALERTLRSVGGGSGGSSDGGGILGALKLNAGVLGVGSLPAVATALGTVASAVQQLAGAGAVLPGALAGIGVTVGTLKVGLSGVSDAFKAVEKSSDGTAKSVAASNAALAKLAPSAAEAVKAGVDIQKQLAGALVKPTQQNLFDGLATSAHKFVDSDLPIVQRGMAGLATALNGNAKQLLTSLGSDSSQSFLDRIFGNTTDAQARLSKAIDPAVHAFGTLAATGSSSLPRLSDGVGKLADRFNKFITSADADGRLDKWINDGITGLSHLGDTVLNIGKAFSSIATAAGGGGGLLSTLDSLTGKLATFLGSDQGQADLRNFFQEGREQLAKWEPIIANIARVLPSLFEGAKQWTNALLPALQSITGFLASSPDLIQGVATAFVAWKSIEGVASLVGKLGGIGSGLDALPGKASGAAGGISSALSKIAIPAAIAGLTLNETNGLIGPGHSAASNLGGAGLDIAGGAAAGGLAFGAPGAIVGAIVGLGASVYQRVLSDIQAGQKAFEDSWTSHHDNPNYPGNPDTANALTGRDKILQPSLNTPTISASLLPAIRAGKVKGFSVGPDGQIVNTDTGQTVNLPGINLAPAPPATPAPPPAPKPVPTSGGVPFPVVPQPAVPSSAVAVPSPVAVPNPITAGPTIAAKVDPAAQQSVDKLATSLQTLPTGEVKITDGSPAVLDSVKRLDVQVSTLKDHPGEVIVKANTEEAQTKLDALIRSYQSRIITLQLQPSIGGAPQLPVAPGKATGGINGILPGYSPGVDNMLVPMSGGEGVIIPQIARQLGPAGIAAINRGELTMAKRGYATGDIVDKDGNPIIAGAAPGPGGFVPGAGPAPIAPNGAGDGVGGIFGSVLSGLGGPISNIAGLASGATGGTSGPAFTSTGSFMDRLAGIPGLAGLIGSAGSSNPGAALNDWGGATGKWLGKFTAKTVGSFGNALWQGALGLVGLDNSILSPNNPWFQAAAKGAGFALDDSGPLGALLGVGDSGTSGKAATEKQIREGGQKVTRADQKVAQIVQRIKELKPNASQSQRATLADQLANAQQDAADARTDFATLTGATTQSTATLPADSSTSSHHGGPAVLTPMSGGEGIIDPAIAAQLGPAGIATINQGGLTIAKKGFAGGGIIPVGALLPAPPTPNFNAAKAAQAQTINPPGGHAQIPNASTKQLPAPVGPPVPSAPAAPPGPPAPSQSSDQQQQLSPDFHPKVGAAPTDYNHNLAAINTGIASGASAIGNAVSMAAGLAGSSGFAPGAGAIGQIAAGAIQEGGKAVTDLVNVGSSFLVGSVPGNLGGDGPAQGSTLTSPQNVPQTAQDNRRSYNIQAGYRPADLIDAIQLHDAQMSQGQLARFRG